MSCIFLESFGQYADGLIAQEDVAGLWVSVTSNPDYEIVDLGDGRKYLHKYNSYSNYDAMVSAPFVADSSTIVVHFTLHRLTGSECNLFQFRDGAAQMGNFGMMSDGRLQYFRAFDKVFGNWNQAVCTSTGATSSGVSDHWIVEIVFHNSAGAVTFYKNGLLDSAFTGLDTLLDGTACDNLVLPFDSADAAGISDLYIDDADVVGPVAVAYEPADLAGSNADFTPAGAATNHEAVDEVGADGDTTYNRSTAPGDIDSLEHSAVAIANGVVTMMVLTRARKENPGTVSIALGVEHGGSITQGSDRGLSEDWEYYWEMFEDVPGGSGWTPAEIEAAEASYKNTTA